MGGWFPDVMVGYVVTFFRKVLRRRKAHRTKDWPTASATLVGINWNRQGYLPRPDTEFVYTYRHEGKFYGGVERKPFYLGFSAESYAKQFAKGDTVMIRVNPTQPEASLILDEDLEKAKRPSVSSPIAT